MKQNLAGIHAGQNIVLADDLSVYDHMGNANCRLGAFGKAVTLCDGIGIKDQQIGIVSAFDTKSDWNPGTPVPSMILAPRISISNIYIPSHLRMGKIFSFITHTSVSISSLVVSRQRETRNEPSMISGERPMAVSV